MCPLSYKIKALKKESQGLIHRLPSECFAWVEARNDVTRTQAVFDETSTKTKLFKMNHYKNISVFDGTLTKT